MRKREIGDSRRREGMLRLRPRLGLGLAQGHADMRGVGPLDGLGRLLLEKKMVMK